jgi:ferrochelatase
MAQADESATGEPPPGVAAPATAHVLLMAAGGPDRPDELPEDQAAEIAARYAAIGGRSSTLAATRLQAEALAARLNTAASGSTAATVAWRVHVAMSDRRPSTEDALADLRAAGAGRAVGLVMTPPYSRLTVGRRYELAAEAGASVELIPIERWHLQPGYLDALADRVRAALERFPATAGAQASVVFTAQSLPEAIKGWDDPYPRELQETVAAVARRIAPRPYVFAYRRAGAGAGPRLGPDLSEVIERLAAEGATQVVVAPIDVVTDDAEVRDDVDIEAKRRAAALGLRLERIEPLNDHPLMIAGLADLIRARAAEAGLTPTPAPPAGGQTGSSEQG